MVAFVLSILGMTAMPSLFADASTDRGIDGDEPIPQLSAGVFSFSASQDSGAGGGESMPLVLNATGNGFEFDVGDSDTRKLHFHLDSQAAALPGRNSIGLGATLEVPFSPSLSLTGEVQQQQAQMNFQSLGSIQCKDGVLSPYSYTASGCRFIDDSISGLNQGLLSLGARYETPSTSTAISWFTRGTDLQGTGTNRLNAIQPSASFGTDLLTPVLSNPLLPGLPVRQPLSYFDGEASGVDLSFQLGVATDNHGDVRFGLALTRVLDADFGGMYSNLTPWSWAVSDAFNTARVDVEWSRGDFSGGIQGFYREQVDFLNREPLDSLTTFDVHFTWRTPWNADLSVGASNILNSGSDEQSAVDTQSADPFESVYGRIPYVRYKQDL